MASGELHVPSILAFNPSAFAFRLTYIFDARNAESEAGWIAALRSERISKGCFGLFFTSRVVNEAPKVSHMLSGFSTVFPLCLLELPDAVGCGLPANSCQP